MKKRIVIALLVAALALIFTGCSLFWATAFPHKIVGTWDLSTGFAALNIGNIQLVISPDQGITGWVSYAPGYGPNADGAEYPLNGWWNIDQLIWSEQGAADDDHNLYEVTGDTLIVTGTLGGAPCTLGFDRRGS
jgi:hypothetical protein